MKQNTFLDKLSATILSQSDVQLSNCLIVLPNKRAKVFLLESLKKEIAFEKERQMEEEDEEEDLGWKEEFAPCRSRKLPCYTIGRENVSKNFRFAYD